MTQSSLRAGSGAARMPVAIVVVVVVVVEVVNVGRCG